MALMIFSNNIPNMVASNATAEKKAKFSIDYLSYRNPLFFVFFSV